MAQVFRSSDPGAQVLSGLPGTLVNVLDDALVAAGWEKQFSDTNRAAYRPPSGTRSVLYVDDRGALGDGRTAYLRGYQAMSSIDAGSGPFPTVAQALTGAAFSKSNAADSTAKTWVAVVTDTAVVLANLAAGTTRYGFVFGDLDPAHNPTDPGRCVLIAGGSNGAMARSESNLTTASTDHYVAQGWQSGASAGCCKVGNSTVSGAGTAIGNGTYPYPDDVSGGFLAVPLLLAEGGRVRGVVPILHGQPHPQTAFTDDTLHTDADGTQYVAVRFLNSAGLLRIT